MDIKPKRREAYVRLPDDYPGTYAQGSAAADQNRFWWVRAQDYSEGAGINSYRDVELENEAEHRRWGTPYEDVLPHPNGVPANVGFSGVSSRNPDDPLGDPCNYHSNPGSTTSTASALQQSRPGSVYRTPGPGSPNFGHRPMPVGGRDRERAPGRTVTPASNARQPQSEGSPLVVSTGFPGR